MLNQSAANDQVVFVDNKRLPGGDTPYGLVEMQA